MWIKICGNTNLDDALMAVALGADALGFIFASSRRQVTPAEAAAIVSQLPPHVEPFGVFDVQTATEIASTVARAGLTGVQLHGTLNTDLVAELSALLEPNICLMQTVAWPVADRTAAEQVRQQLEHIDRLPDIGRVMLDSRVGPVSGGTGVAFRWSEAAEAFRETTLPDQLVLAGGLRPENVAAAITTLRPWGVDVATGVEQRPGRKDHQKLKLFIENARVAAESNASKS